jgi:hypothetical protein
MRHEEWITWNLNHTNSILLNTSIYVPFIFLFLSHSSEVTILMHVLFKHYVPGDSFTLMWPLQVQQFSSSGGLGRQFKRSIIFYPFHLFFKILIHEINDPVSFLESPFRKCTSLTWLSEVWLLLWKRLIKISYLFPLNLCNLLFWRHKKKTPWSEPAIELHRPSDRRLSAKWCQLLRIEGATWSVWRILKAVFSVF